MLFLLFSCSLGNFQSRHSSDLGVRNIKRIAILPSDPILNNPLYSTMAALPDWHIVSDREVREVGALVPQGDARTRAKKLGELVYADAVIFGQVLRYHERVGEEWGAKSPASVAFVLDLWDVRRGDLIWSGSFDETQRPLSDNILAIGEFTQRGGKWLRAEELALEGIKKAVNQLHQTLYRSAA